MDWIEKLLGLSPDGGSGATELLFATVVVLAVVAVGLRAARGRRA